MKEKKRKGRKRSTRRIKDSVNYCEEPLVTPIFGKRRFKDPLEGLLKEKRRDSWKGKSERTGK